MLSYFILGATFAFAAVVQPGPLQAYLISRAASHGWRRTLPGAFAPLLSDGPIIAAAVLLLSGVPPWFSRSLRIAGGCFVLYLAWGACQSWRKGRPAGAATGPAPRGLLEATAINFLNPNPWISWSLVLCPLLLKAWREAPSHAGALLAGFYGVLVAGLAGMVVLCGMARELGPGVSRALVGISAAALAVFGGYLLWTAI